MKNLFLLFSLVGFSHTLSCPMGLVKQKETFNKNIQEYFFGNLTQLPPELRYIIFLDVLKSLHSSNQFNNQNLFHLDMLAFCNWYNKNRSNRELVSLRAPFKLRCFHSKNCHKDSFLKKINTRCFVLVFPNQLQICQLVNGKWETQIFTANEDWVFASIDENTFFSLSQNKGIIWKFNDNKWSQAQDPFELKMEHTLLKKDNKLFIYSKKEIKILLNNNGLYLFQALEHSNCKTIKVLNDNRLLTASREDGAIKIWHFSNDKWQKAHQLQHADVWKIKKINDNTFVSASTTSKLFQFLNGKWIEQILDHTAIWNIKRVNNDMFLTSRKGKIKVWHNLNKIWQKSQTLKHIKQFGICLSLLNENTFISYGTECFKIWHYCKGKNLFKEMFHFKSENDYFNDFIIFKPKTFIVLGNQILIYQFNITNIDKQTLKHPKALAIHKMDDTLFISVSNKVLKMWQLIDGIWTNIHYQDANSIDRLVLKSETFVTLSSQSPPSRTLTICSIPTIKEILEDIKQERKGKQAT